VLPVLRLNEPPGVQFLGDLVYVVPNSFQIREQRPCTLGVEDLAIENCVPQKFLLGFPGQIHAPFHFLMLGFGEPEHDLLLSFPLRVVLRSFPFFLGLLHARPLFRPRPVSVRTSADVGRGNRGALSKIVATIFDISGGVSGTGTVDQGYARGDGFCAGRVGCQEGLPLLQVLGR